MSEMTKQDYLDNGGREIHIAGAKPGKYVVYYDNGIHRRIEKELQAGAVEIGGYMEGQYLRMEVVTMVLIHGLSKTHPELDSDFIEEEMILDDTEIAVLRYAFLRNTTEDSDAIRDLTRQNASVLTEALKQFSASATKLKEEAESLGKPD